MRGTMIDRLVAKAWNAINAWYDAQTVVQQLTDQRERAYDQVYRLMREKAELQEKLNKLTGVDELLSSSFTCFSERLGSGISDD